MKASQWMRTSNACAAVAMIGGLVQIVTSLSGTPADRWTVPVLAFCVTGFAALAFVHGMELRGRLGQLERWSKSLQESRALLARREEYLARREDALDRRKETLDYREETLEAREGMLP